MKFKQKHIFPPSLVILNGQKYMMPSWTKVPMDTELSDLEWEQPVFTKKVLATFKSSSGNGVYEITYSGKMLTCSCVGFKFNNKCKHLTQYKNDTK